MTANGAGIVLCTKSEEGNELFADAPFPVILYNDSLKAAVGKNSGMIEDEEIPNTASWYVNGSFYSSWSLKVDAEDLVEDAAAFVEMSQDKELSGADSADSGAWSQWVDMRKTTVCLLAAAVLMMGFGLWRGEGAAVLSKGINLCMECVGIG